MMSIIKTKHSLIAARPDDNFIIDNNKKRWQALRVSATPAQDAKAITLMNNIDWDNVNCNDRDYV